MKHHIEVVISDSEWVDILTVHSETGSAIGSSVPIENVQELIYKLEKILNDKRNVERGGKKVCNHELEIIQLGMSPNIYRCKHCWNDKSEW